MPTAFRRKLVDPYTRRGKTKAALSAEEVTGYRHDGILTPDCRVPAARVGRDPLHAADRHHEFVELAIFSL